MKNLLIVLFVLIFGLVSVAKSDAIFDPLARPNNIHGIHILFPTEIGQAAKLVNSSNGEWGYVTIPIQIGDRDLFKWQHFMDEAKKQKIIPILRLSTEGYYANTNVWRIPDEADIVDFANFLNSLDWPIENRYVIIFNEMNRYDEWGGESPDPEKYADLLDFAVNTFKSRSNDFFVIMGGLDNAAPNDGVKYMDNFVYLRKMAQYKQEVFDKIDAFASHSYPNPDFAQPPLLNQREGITTYQYEYQLVNSFATHKVPVFITETGWNSTKLGETVVSSYYKIAYDNFWGKDNDKVIAVTPFLLNSQGGAFDTFSFVKNGLETKYFNSEKDENKTKGDPLVKSVEGIETSRIPELKTKIFAENIPDHTLGNKLIFAYIKFFF